MIAVLVLSMAVGFTWPTVEARTQGTIRTLEKVHLKNEPVEIVEIKVGTKRISLSQGFMADGDWVSNLSIKVKNLSEKQIVRIELELEFPEVTRNGDVLLLPMRYGQLPGVEDSGPKEEGLVGPNEFVEIGVGGDSYGGIKNLLTDGGRNPGLVTKARVQVAAVIFADGTAWRLGFNLIRDPKDPRHYIRVSKDIGRTTTPSRMGF